MATEEKTINVVGMHCPSCVAAVELSIKDLDGVEDAKADLESNTAKVTFDSDKVSDSDLAEGRINYLPLNLFYYSFLLILKYQILYNLTYKF